jgi:hypothetical protein
MAQEITDLLTRDPGAASDLLNYLKTSPRMNAEQRRAVHEGLAEALARLKANNLIDEWDDTWIIIVVLIVGVLAALGYWAYTKRGDGDFFGLISPN